MDPNKKMDGIDCLCMALFWLAFVIATAAAFHMMSSCL